MIKNKMKPRGYIWQVIVSLITLGVVLSIFTITSTRFEITVLSILVLLYSNIMTFMATWSFTHIESSIRIGDDFSEIKRLLNHWKNWEDYTDEALKNDLAQREKLMRNYKIKYYIGLGFQALISIIAIWHLLAV